MVHEFSTICMGHARHYQQDQPELAVWCLLCSIDVIILHLGDPTISPVK